MESWETGRGRGGVEGVGDETREFLAITGGDGDNTGVHPTRPTDGSTGTSAHVKVEPVPEGEQFPAVHFGHCTD